MSRSATSPARSPSSTPTAAPRSPDSRVATGPLAPPRPAAPPGRRLSALQLALGAAGLAACALAVAAGVSAVHVAPAAAHRLHLGGVRLTYPAVNAAAALLLAQAA